MRKERKKGFTWSATLHAIVFILLFLGLPAIFEPPHISEPQVLTVEILPITGITNVKPSESTPAPKPEPQKQPEAQKSAPPVKTAEATPTPPAEEKEKKEQKPEKKSEEKKSEKKPEKKKEEDLLAVLKAVKATADKEAKKNAEKAETNASKSKSQQYNPELPMSLSEKDAIKGQISKCWNVPAGAKDAQDLVIVLRVQYEKDGSLINVALADKSKSRYGADTFFRAAADSALRAVRMCTPLHSLPPDKYETWRDMELTFDPKEMLF